MVFLELAHVLVGFQALGGKPNLVELEDFRAEKIGGAEQAKESNDAEGLGKVEVPSHCRRAFLIRWFFRIQSSAGGLVAGGLLETEAWARRPSFSKVIPKSTAPKEPSNPIPFAGMFGLPWCPKTLDS